MQTHPFQDLIDRLDANLREEFEERAGIVEFDGLQPREHAEALALLHVLRRHPAALLGVTVVDVEIEGRERCALVTDRTARRLHLVCTVHRDLATVVSEQFNGAALLSPLP